MVCPALNEHWPSLFFLFFSCYFSCISLTSATEIEKKSLCCFFVESYVAVHNAVVTKLLSLLVHGEKKMSFHRCCQEKLRDAAGRRCCYWLGGQTLLAADRGGWGWAAEEGFSFSSKIIHHRDELLICWDKLLVMLVTMELVMLVEWLKLTVQRGDAGCCKVADGGLAVWVHDAVWGDWWQHYPRWLILEYMVLGWRLTVARSYWWRKKLATFEKLCGW